MIVQRLLEDVVGEPFSVIMQKSVLEPWEMAATTFESPLPKQLRSIAASGHRADGAIIPGGWHTYPEMGAGASMWATPSDLAQFATRVMQAYAGQADGVLSGAMAAVVVLLLVAGCGEVEPTATPVPATATQFAQRATSTPLPSTATPTPPTPTETTGGERGLGQGLGCRGRGQRVLGHVVTETDARQRCGCEATGRDAAVNLTQMPAPYPKSSDKEEST